MNIQHSTANNQHPKMGGGVQERAGRAWELILEGHPRAVFERLELIARRELFPAIAKASDTAWNQFQRSGVAAGWPAASVLAAIHGEERVVRRAQKIHEKPTRAPADAVAAWWRAFLDDRKPMAAWGILCQAQMMAEDAVQPATGAAAVTLYRELRAEGVAPEEVIRMARMAARKARE